MNPNYDIRVVSELNQDLQQQLQELRNNTSDIFGEKPNQDHVTEHLDKYCSDKDIKRWIFAFEGDSMIGMIAIFSRTIVYSSQSIVLGGIGKVKVRDDRRRQGVSSEMMKKAMVLLYELNVDVAFLCTKLDSFLADFYHKYGFIILDKEYTYVGKSGKSYYESDGMLAPIKSTDVFQKIMNGEIALNLGVGNW